MCKKIINMGWMLALFMMFQGCVLKAKHDETIASNLKMSSDLSTTVKEREDLKKQLDETRKQITDLEMRNENLEKTNQDLANKNKEYADQSLTLQNELLNLKKEKQTAEGKIEFITKTYDDLIKTLKNEIAQGEISVTQSGDRLSVHVSDQVLFPSGSAQIEEQGKKVLKKLVPVLVKSKDKNILIEGHTDNIPIQSSLKSQFDSNWELSASRSITVVRYLQEMGIMPSQLIGMAYGEHKPMASNKTPEGRKQNRRIEIVLSPMRSKNMDNVQP